MEEILTAEQVAKILQVHPFTVLKFIRAGKLKASKLGRVYRIRMGDVEAFLDNQIQQPAKTKKAATNEAAPSEEAKKTSTSNKDSKSREGKKKQVKDQKTPKIKQQEVEVLPKQQEVSPPSPSQEPVNYLDHYVIDIQDS